MLEIREHRLCRAGTPVRFVRSPHTSVQIRPRWLVMHYTADAGEAAVNWFADPRSKVSAHVVIARDGAITQAVPFDRDAWHAGESAWQGVVGLNRHSLGVELVNLGRLRRRPDGWYAEATGRRVHHEEVHPDGASLVGWHRYTDAQLAAARAVGALLVRQYGLKDVLGHEQIAPVRKFDPGPAFPMAAFRAHCLAPLKEVPPAPPGGVRVPGIQA